MQQKFTLNPFGSGVIEQILHRGRMFDIYLAELCGQKVCLKTPVALPDRDYYCSDYYCHTGSETFYGGETWNQKSDKFNTLRTTPAEDLKIATGMLLMESQLIQWTQGAWNHSIIGQGVWDRHSIVRDPRNKWEQEYRQQPLCAGFLPVLVMPYHRTVRLADLAKTEQRKLFPRMLPALWAALSQMYHGDLSEANILIEPDRSRFHLIDPGVMLVSVSIGSTDNSVLQDDRSASVFTTTTANYPLLPPFDPFLSNSNCQSLTLQDCLQISIDRTSWSSTPRLQPDKYGIFSFDVRAIANFHQPPQRRSRPLPSDLLALGLIYFRILTDEELFLGREIMPDCPAWQGELPRGFLDCKDGSIFQTYQRVAKALAENYIAKELDRHSLSLAEKELVFALLNLQIEHQAQLAELTINLAS